MYRHIAKDFLPAYKLLTYKLLDIRMCTCVHYDKYIPAATTNIDIRRFSYYSVFVFQIEHNIFLELYTIAVENITNIKRQKYFLRSKHL